VRGEVGVVVSYASVTGTRRNLAALEEHGWRLLVDASATRAAPPGWGYALDNGAWGAHRRGGRVDEVGFGRGLSRWGDRADWVVAPDVVAGGAESLALSLRWLSPCLDSCRAVLLAVQDGMLEADVAPFLGPRVGLFVGGTTRWKESTVAAWGSLARRVGAWCHVGRVNTARRIYLCASAGAHSFDGTKCSRYAMEVPALSHARDQLSLFSWGK